MSPRILLTQEIPIFVMSSKLSNERESVDVESRHTIQNVTVEVDVTLLSKNHFSNGFQQIAAIHRKLRTQILFKFKF